MQVNRFKKLAFTVLCLSSLLSVTANAAARKNVLLNSYGLASPAKATQDSVWKGDRIYLGEHEAEYDTRDSEDIIWDVLDPSQTNNENSEGIYLLSSYSVTRSAFNPTDKTGNTYFGSTLEGVMTSIYDEQESVIRDSFMPTNESDASKHLDYLAGGTSGNSYGVGILSDALFFPPSAYDLDKEEYGFYHIGASVDSSGDGTVSRMSKRTEEKGGKTMAGSVFWTRSPYLAQTSEAGAVAGGIVTSKYVSGTYNVAPAANLNRKKIAYMMESSADKGTSLALTSNLANPYADWRVALKDVTNGKTSAQYQGLDENGGIKLDIKSHATMKHTPTQMTAILTNPMTNEVAAYGKIASPDATGAIVIPKPANIAHGEYRLYIFDEAVTREKRKPNYTSNIYGENDSEKMIIDYGALKILTHPESLTVIEGEDADFSVTTKNAEGYKWQYSLEDDVWVDINDNNEQVQSIVTSDLTAGTSSCKLSGVLLDFDGMVIRCLVTGNGGQLYSSEFAILTVNPDLSKKTSSSSTSSSEKKKSSGGKGEHHHKKKSSSSEVIYSNSNPNPSPTPVAVKDQNVWTQADWDNYNKALAILAYNESVKKQSSASVKKPAASKSSSSSSVKDEGTSSSLRNTVIINTMGVSGMIRKEPEKLTLRKKKKEAKVEEEPVKEVEEEKESFWVILWQFLQKIFPWLLMLIILIIIILIILSMIRDRKNRGR